MDKIDIFEVCSKYNGDNYNQLKQYLESGGNANILNESSKYSNLIVCGGGNSLLSRVIKMPVNYQGGDKQQVIDTATGMVKLLLQYGADPKIMPYNDIKSFTFIELMISDEDYFNHAGEMVKVLFEATCIEPNDNKNEVHILPCPYYVNGDDGFFDLDLNNTVNSDLDPNGIGSEAEQVDKANPYHE